MKKIIVAMAFFVVFASQAKNELYNAVNNNDAKKVLELLKNGANPNGDEPNKVPLVTAVTWNKKDIVTILLDNPYKKADVNYYEKELYRGTETKTTALLQAVFKSVEIVILLLKNGANPNLVDQDGDTALHRLIIAVGNVGTISGKDAHQMIKLLLSAGADLTIKNNAGQTPLALANQLGGEVGNLFSKAVDDWKKEHKGKSIKQVARRMANPNITQGHEFETMSFKFE